VSRRLLVIDMAPASLLFHHALQRMLVFTRKVHNLRHFGFGHFIRVDPAFPDAVMVEMQHDAGLASWQNSAPATRSNAFSM
jgi:hypothetical protein